MMSDSFKLEILAPGRADVFLDSDDGDIPWPVIEKLDKAEIRVIGALPGSKPNEEWIRSVLGGCAGLVTTMPDSAITQAPPITGEPVDMARLIVSSDTPADLSDFLDAVLNEDNRIRPYAFMIGRMERDFRQAREAIGVAVESESGIPCLWSDGCHHRTNIESVREQTRLLIKHARFVVADLTLGVESPKRENPSRAHEIGMAMAYEKPLMLCSQEPRRYPYFSIGDMQMAFWSTEDELEKEVKRWIDFNRELVANRVYNYQLPDPKIAKPVFSYDPKLGYVGPGMGPRMGLRRLLTALNAKLL